MQAKRKWSRGEKLAAWTLLATVIAIVTVFVVPEVRTMLRLERRSPALVRFEEVKPAGSPAAPKPEPRKEHAQHAKSSAVGNTVKGAGNALAGSITQGPGSIAQIGGAGNTATIYNAPSEANLTAHYDTQTVQEANGVVSYAIVVTINTDRTTQGPQLTITCDAPCDFKSMDLGAYALIGTNRRASDRTVEVGLSQQFRPNQTLRVVLSGKAPFHVVSITKM